jgi:FeS assembly SUF system protein
MDETQPESTAEISSRQELPVLPHSSKVERMKEEVAPTPHPPPVSPHNPQPSYSSPPAGFGMQPMHKSSPNLTTAQRALEATVIEVLRTVYDPEIPVNIYELGLIYEIQIDAENHVKVVMTLTSPGCPVAGSLPPAVEQKVEAIPEVKSADVMLVWEPAWDKSRMSESAMLDLGLV